MDLTGAGAVAWAPVVGLALLVRTLLPQASDPSATPWSWLQDGALALVSGLATMALCAFWFTDFQLYNGTFLVSDFHEYCPTVYAQATGDLGETSKARSWWSVAAAAWLSQRVGIIDGLAGNALLGTWATGTGLYLWGRAAHGRLAGVGAALCMTAIAPLSTLSHTLSLYSIITGGLALCTGAAAVALRFPRWSTLTVGGLGIGLALLIDLRGLFWALPAGGLVLLGIARTPPRSWAPRLGLLAALLGLAWLAAPTSYPPHMDPLEAHISLRKRLSDNGFALPDDFPEATTTYVWGRSSPLEIPATLMGIAERSSHVPTALRDARGGAINRARFAVPWLAPGLGAGLVALAGLAFGRRRLVRAAVVVGLALPWLVSLKGAIDVQRSFPRFLGSAMPVLALGLGLAWATLASGRAFWQLGAPDQGWRAWSGWSRIAPLRPALALGLLLALLLGGIPSALSPLATWRVPIGASLASLQRSVEIARGERPGDPRYNSCADALHSDIRAGLDPAGRLYGGIYAD